MKVEILLSTLSLLALIACLLAYNKLRRKNRLILDQSNEINKHLHELEQQNQQLQELLQERQQLFSVVSHDLKGPFNRIFALIQLMKMSSKSWTDEQLEYMGKMHQVSIDGLSMVRNLLDNRRFESKGIELTHEPLNLTSVITTLLRNYTPLADTKKIHFHFNKSADIIVHADKTYLNRILENLLSNALKFSPPNTSITIIIKEKDDNAEISIADNGPGISAYDQTKLFQKFQTLSARPTGGESSTGLGLSIAKAIVDKMNGQIFCSSENGSGACFTVRIPAHNHQKK